MATIELRKASKSDEILIRFYQGSKFNLRAKSGIFCDAKFFAYVIDQKATLKAWSEEGKRAQLKATTATTTEAAKHGYILLDRGDFVDTTFRLMTPEVESFMEARKAMQQLQSLIIDEYHAADPAVLRGKWLQDVVDAFHGRSTAKDAADAPLTMQQLGKAYLAAKSLSANRERHFESLLRLVARYEMFRRLVEKDADFAFIPAKVTPDDMTDLFDYIANEAELQRNYPKQFEKILKAHPLERSHKHNATTIPERGRNRVATLEKMLRMVFKWADDGDRIEGNRPFKGVEMTTENYGTPFYLTLDERNLVADFDLSATPSLAVQRDIFIFQCLTGCRISDLMTLTEDANVVGNFLEYIPSKTKDDANQAKAIVPLVAGDNDRAMRLIEAYRGADARGRLFPFIAAQNYNEAIKRVLKACGVTRMVQRINPTSGEAESKPICDIASSHMARRTFVGTAYKQVKDPNLVGKMSGHVEGSAAFRRYRDIDKDDLVEVMARLK